MGIYPFDTAELNFNMALDEILLNESIEKGVAFFRCYSFLSQSCSLGYFQDASSFDSSDLSWTRRLTGGGIVQHGKDMVISMSFPKPAGQKSILFSYCHIHTVIQQELNELGITTQPFAERTHPSLKRHYACFSNPVEYDLCKEGEKIVGGALYRRKDWFLYQGSLQMNGSTFSVSTGEGFVRQFKKNTDFFLGKIPEEVPFSEEQMKSAQRLAVEKYQSVRWKKKMEQV
jgi:lipoate-protein ligase A